MATDVKWIKIATDIFDDEKIYIIEQLPDADAIIVIWFKLLTLAGKVNTKGVLMINDRIPYTEEMLAGIFRRKISQLRLALETFQELGMIEIINSIITIPNWNKHQQLDTIEKRREFMKEYMRERRDKQRQLALSGKPNSKPNGKQLVNSLDNISLSSSNSVSDSNDFKEETKKDNVRQEIEKDIELDKDKKNNKGTFLYYENEDLNNLFNEFLNLRKKLKAVNTERAVSLLLGKLEPYSDELKEKMIEQSITNSWKGLFPIKVDFVKEQKKPNKFENIGTTV